jgi:dipeptide transport system ATP-binding protein
VTDEPILVVEDLHVVFPTPGGEVRAVSGVSFEVEKGEIYGIVGESGCGKSATGKAILRLVPPPGKIAAGRILFHGEDLVAKSEQEMRQLRGRRIAMVFQDPAASLNPLFTIGQQLEAIMKRHRMAKGDARRERAMELLADLGLPHPEDILSCYPHQLSGGMQQRAMIAMALSAEPDLILADEPTSALDVTIQSQILDLLIQLREQHGVTIILVTHDLGIVAETCDRLAVFYLGCIVEQGAAPDIFHDTKHPYTQGLLGALPHPSNWGDALKMIPGTVPTLMTAVVGCPFASRCEQVMEACWHVAPPDISFGPSHRAACHLYADPAQEGERG